jgi:hypothetical protein
MKNKIITITISLLLIILFFGGDDGQDLGNDYYYLPDYEAIDMGFPGGAIIYKSKQKYVFNDIKVYKNVVNANSNNDFVLAIQKLDDFSIEKDSLQYYIIVKKTDLVHGPYNKKKYSQKREELGVPEKLKLVVK